MLTVKAIYEQYKNDVYLYLYSLTHDGSLSEDLTSETFLAAIKSFARFRGDSSIKTWLFSIARHKWYEHLRKQKNELSPEALTENYIASQCRLQNDADTGVAAKRALELLDTEDERTKSIFLMRIEGFSFAQIAEKHGISEGSARVIEFRVRNKIKEILLKEGYGNE